MPSNSDEIESAMMALTPENDPGACGLCLKLFSTHTSKSILIEDAAGHKAGEEIGSIDSDTGHYSYVADWSPNWANPGKPLRLAFAHIRCWKRKERREKRGKET